MRLGLDVRKQRVIMHTILPSQPKPYPARYANASSDAVFSVSCSPNIPCQQLIPSLLLLHTAVFVRSILMPTPHLLTREAVGPVFEKGYPVSAMSSGVRADEELLPVPKAA